METKDIECEYLLDNGLCKAVAENEVGKALRKESCVNELKSACCYLCDNRRSCAVSCDFLDTFEDKLKMSVDVEISKTQRAVRRLSVFFAEGKMSEESYLNSIAELENRTKRLRDAKNDPKLLEEQGKLLELESSSVEARKPTRLWYLISFFFMLIGGLIAYVATKDSDEDMATSCLALGILSTLLGGFLWWVLFLS